MHPLRHPRNVVVIGIGFIAAAAVYAFGAEPLGYDVEWSGVTMLGALGVAMSLMAYVLIAGSSNE